MPSLPRLVCVLSLPIAIALALAACRAEAPAPPVETPGPAPVAGAPATQPAKPAEAAPATPAVIGTLKAEMAYADLRKSLMDDGWLPLRDPQCWDNVGGEARVCAVLAEVSSCSGDGHCLMRFAKPPADTLTVSTYGPYADWDKPAQASDLRVKFWTASRLEAPSAACPSQSFDAFLQAFAADKAVRAAFTSSLVKVIEIEDRGDEGYFPRTVYVAGQDYDGFDVAYDRGAYRRAGGEGAVAPEPLKLDIASPSADARDVRYAYGSSEGNSYRFQRRDGCWYLSEDPEAPQSP